MPLTRKGSEILQSMRGTYPTEKKAKQVFYASINAGKITGAEKGKQGHHRPVTNSPFHGLRPPHPEGAQHDRQRDYVPVGHRGVKSNAGREASMTRPGNEAQHRHLAKEVAGGLRSFSFAKVRRNQPAPPPRG